MTQAFSTILITGGTGSLGQALTRFLLANTDATIRIYSRSELLQAQMRVQFGQDRLRYLLGDVRDLARLYMACIDVDCVFHIAALKHIDAGQYNPMEFSKTNIQGTENVSNACQAMGVKRAILVSTDKAVYSVNVYGHTKAMAEQLWTHANAYDPRGTIFSAIRYGNVIDSRGSVVPIWRQALTDNKPLPLTHPEMTRFHLTLPAAVRLAWFAAVYGPRGSILVPHLPAYSLKMLAQAVVGAAGVPWERVQWQEIGVRPGEKMHECLMTNEEAGATILYTENGTDPLYYCIPPVAPSWRMESTDTLNQRTTGQWIVEPLTQPYRSDCWRWRLGREELREQLREMP